MADSRKFITRHAEARCKQRGIDEESINLLMRHGVTHRHAGADVTCFDKYSWAAVLKERPCSSQKLERLRKVYLVEEDGFLLTAGQRTKRFKRDVH
jgi:hypothetical protein